LDLCAAVIWGSLVAPAHATSTLATTNAATTTNQ
jgi:hypothetical protein